MTHKVVEYERPKMIPGQYVRSYDAPAGSYQTQQTSQVPPLPPPLPSSLSLLHKNDTRDGSWVCEKE